MIVFNLCFYQFYLLISKLRYALINPKSSSFITLVTGEIRKPKPSLKSTMSIFYIENPMDDVHVYSV